MVKDVINEAEKQLKVNKGKYHICIYLYTGLC